MASAQMEELKGSMRQMMAAGFAPRFDEKMDPLYLRKIIQAAQARMQLEPGITFEISMLGGVETERSVPQNARDNAVVLYIHGGGLICGTAETSRGYAGMLAGESGFPVYSLSYRLAPENKFPAALEDCFSVYRALLEKHPGKPIFLIGESGGAYLSIVTALKARDVGITLPAGIIPYSAPIDFSGALNRSFPGNKDFTVTPTGIETLAELYCPLEQRKEPYVSPYYADYTGMPPMFLVWDKSESLAVDNEVLRDKALAAGVEVVWKAYPDCFHAFATAGRGTPESYEVLENTIAFLNAHI